MKPLLVWQTLLKHWMKPLLVANVTETLNETTACVTNFTETLNETIACVANFTETLNEIIACVANLTEYTKWNHCLYGKLYWNTKWNHCLPCNVFLANLTEVVNGVHPLCWIISCKTEQYKFYYTPAQNSIRVRWCSFHCFLAWIYKDMYPRKQSISFSRSPIPKSLTLKSRARVKGIKHPGPSPIVQTATAVNFGLFFNVSVKK